MSSQGKKETVELFQFLYPRGFQPYRIKWFDIGVSLFLLLVTFIVYVKTIAPSVIAGDNGELTTEIYNMGACHPPGYPLYGIVGKLFTFIPVGDIAFRVNIFAALAGAAAVALFYLIVVKLIGFNRDTGKLNLFVNLPAAASSFLFAFGMTNWYCVVNGKFYSLNTLLVTLMVYVMILWYEEMIHFRNEETIHFADRLTILLGLCMGLSLTNHHLPLFYFVAYLVVLLPVTVTLVVAHKPSKFREELSKRKTVLLVFLGMALISLYLFFKHAYFNRLLMPDDVPPLMTTLLLIPSTAALYSIIVKYAKVEKNWVDDFIRLLSIGMIMFLFAISLYYYLVIRAKALAPLPDPKPLSWGDTQTLDILFNHILRRQYGMGGGNEYNNLWGQLGAVANLFIKQFTWVNLLIAGIGFVYFFIREKIWAIYTIAAMFLLNLALIKFINFTIDPRTVSTQEPYFNQSYIFIALFIAFGFQLILDAVQYFANKKKAA